MTGNPLDPFGLGDLAASIAVGGIIMSFSLAQFAVPIWLLARRQPEREPFAPRAVITLALLLLLNMTAGLATFYTPDGSPARYLCNFLSYSLLLVLFVPAVLTCWETSVWNALFCVTAGYTIQNLGTGIGELVRIAIEAARGVPIGIGGTVIISNVGCALAILACWRPFVIRASRIRRLGSDARGMLGMLALVIVVVIAYDVVIRGLGTHGAAVGFLAVLRIVHAAVCAFVLYAEYQMLYNARLQSEIATAKVLASERERQYALSRDTIAAVNRRVHDIRHAVLRELSGGDAQLDRTTLADIACDIDVFGATVRTGNDALDTILTEYALLAGRKGVTLSCIADGTALAWVDAASLYALFGNLLDQVLRCEEALPAERRTASLTLRTIGALALLHIECPADEGAGQKDGLELTQAQALVEHLGGTIVLSTADSTHRIDIMLPTG